MTTAKRPVPRTAFKKGDPRASAAGKKGKRLPVKDARAKKAQAAFERLIYSGITMPEGFVPPSALELQEMARTLMPAVLTFAATVMSDDKTEPQEKFQAARLLTQYGASAAASDAEEMTRMRTALETLQTEHRKITTAMRRQHRLDLDRLKKELSAQHAEGVKALQAQLAEANAKLAIKVVA